MPKKPPGKPPSLRPGHADRDSVGQRSSEDPNDLRYIACHEAGHAVAAVVLGLELFKVDIIRRRLPDGNYSLGFTNCPVPAKDIAGKGEEAAFPFIVQCMAGPLAESRVNPDLLNHGGSSSDFEGGRRIAIVALCRATDLRGGKSEISPAEQARMKPAIDALLTRCIDASDVIVDAHQDAIEKVAQLLIARRSMTGQEVTRIVETAKASSQLPN